MFEFISITRFFGHNKVLDKVSFKVNKGEIVGYVGLNGAGKTTTIRIGVGVLPPTSGDVLIDGLSITRDKRSASRRIGWVPEKPIFEQDFKAIDYFVYLAGFYGLSMSEARSLGKKLLEEVGLGNAMNKKLKEYSYGMNKRFALAVSMINNPENYMFDEVLNGLDPSGIAFFRDLTLKLKREGCSILFSSHILSEVESIADRVVFIHSGKIIADMGIEEVRSRAEPSLRILVHPLDEKAIRIVREHGDAVINKNYIVVRNVTNSSEVIEKLVLNGYKVLEVSKTERDLEQVFFKLIKGEAQ